MDEEKISRGSVTVGSELGVVVRPVALAVIVLEVAGAVVFRATSPADGGLNGLVALHGLLLVCAGAALVWGRHRIGVVLTLASTVLALGWQSLGTDFLLWVLLAGVAGLRGSRATRLGCLGLGLVVAALLGARTETAAPGSGLAVGSLLALLVVAGIVFGRVVGSQWRAVTAARTRALALLLQAENIREAERRRLAEELQNLLTAGLGDLGVVATRSPDSGSDTLRATLDEIDARSRSLLSQTRQLLSALREGGARAADTTASAQEAQRLRPVRIAVTTALAVAGFAGLAVHGSSAAGWMQLASCAAVAVMTWTPAVGILAPVLTLAAVMAAAALGVEVSLWTALLTGALCFVASDHRPRWTPLNVVLTALVAAFFLLVQGGGSAEVGWLHAYSGLAGSLGGAARRTVRREEDHAREDLRRSRSSGERAVEEERKKLARELHDVVAYQLSTMTMRIMAASTTQDRGVLAATVDACAEGVHAAQDELDTLLRGLRHETDETPHVSPLAMGVRVGRELRRAGFHPVVDLDATADALERAQVGTVVRVLQEATSNILRYAEPDTACTIELRVHPERTVLSVRSVLSSVHRPSSLSHGMGLRGIRERVDLLGGRFGAGPEGEHWHLWIDVPSSCASADPKGAAALTGAVGSDDAGARAGALRPPRRA